MYSPLLAIHSILRWVVLLMLLYAIFRAYQGWLGGKSFLKSDSTVRTATSGIIHLQFVVGIILYVVSPLTTYFLSNFKEAVQQSHVRFFGMEHSVMMFLAVVFVTIGSAASKRKKTDRQKFKTLAIWFTIALLLILSSIPWEFSPLVSRPNFRGF